MIRRCQRSCLAYPPNCPADKCKVLFFEEKNIPSIFFCKLNLFMKCLSHCEAIGRLAEEEGTDVFCHRCFKIASTTPVFLFMFEMTMSMLVLKMFSISSITVYHSSTLFRKCLRYPPDCPEDTCKCFPSKSPTQNNTIIDAY